MLRKTVLGLLALLVALSMLAGCSQDKNTTHEVLKESEIIASMEALTATTTATEVVTTTTAETTVTTEEDTSLITADTREELAIGLLKAICADDEKLIARYGYSNEDYLEVLRKSKALAGLDSKSEVNTNDFEVYVTGAFNGSHYEEYSEFESVYIHIISSKMTSLELKFVIEYDWETEQFICQKKYGLQGISREGQYEMLSSRFTNDNILPIQ